MRSRFPDPQHKQQLTSWQTCPLFKRVAYGQYMLLSPEELALFRRLVETGDPRIYADEYDLNVLAPIQAASAASAPVQTRGGPEQGSAQR